jgi:hypothetical protein
MLSVHSRREIPREFGIEGITDDNLPGSIRSALLEMVTIGNSVIIVASATGSLWAIRNFAVDGQRTSIESLQNNFLVRGSLRRYRDRIEETKKQDHQNGQKKFSRHLSLILEPRTFIYRSKDSIF